MQLWQQITEFLLRLIDSADDLTIFLFVVLEEAGPGIVGELFRKALFGLSLGVSYALLRAARQEPVVAEAAGAIGVAGEAV